MVSVLRGEISTTDLARNRCRAAVFHRFAMPVTARRAPRSRLSLRPDVEAIPSLTGFNVPPRPGWRKPGVSRKTTGP